MDNINNTNNNIPTNSTIKELPQLGAGGLWGGLVGLRVNEIFYSLQGEGRWAGRAAVFVRFSGCNLRCPFCDTDFTAYEEMTADDIVNRVKAESEKCRFVVITGGEPTLQIDEALIELFHSEGYYVTIETNGTRQYPENIDWVTFSPKDAFVNNAVPAIKRANELKVVFDGKHEVRDYDVDVEYRYLQPCDTGDEHLNKEILQKCIAFIEENPEWQLSLQQHKIINVR